jgi:alpha-amylase
MLRRNLLLLLLCLACSVAAQPPRKMILQAYWWDYYNNHYPEGWANYLVELAPRLQEMGVDAVWIPPATKGDVGFTSVGYDVFDHYDLGDKFQKGVTGTRLGTKDELLRLIAVMHAYGIEVIADVVPNHVQGGEIDPAAWNNQYKNFRYVCVDTDINTETSARTGRFPKNWQNFNPNPVQPSTNYPLYNEMFGPDICYLEGAFGQSSNAIYNPAQSPNYMRNGMIDWAKWYYKQVGFDGVRLDAAKHYPADVVEQMLGGLQNEVQWAGQSPSFNTKGDRLFAVSEFVSELGYDIDDFCNAAGNRTGTFDFELRDAIYGMAEGNGFFDMAAFPSAQQSNRGRTVPFVNNHDTFRPMLSPGGNYIGWDLANELRTHIDPFNPRLITAYAVAFAMDGSPQVFFEDLFNIGGLNNRWTHHPENAAEMPARDRLANLIWCWKALRLSEANYVVSTVSGNPDFVDGSPEDALIIERDPSGINNSRAVIGINDNGAQWQSVWVTTDFQPGITLKDYSGANGAWTYVVPADRRVLINIPPADLINGGYCVIAPEGFDNTPVTSPPMWTIQEWEMANDLGDLHPNSLGQGGALPANDDQTWRTVGRIYLSDGASAFFQIHQSITPQALDFQLISDDDGSVVLDLSGTFNGWCVNSGCLTFISSNEGYYTMRVKNHDDTNPSQTFWVRANYVNYPGFPELFASIGNAALVDEPETIDDLQVNSDGLQISPNPVSRTTIIQYTIKQAGHTSLRLYNSYGKEVMVLYDARQDAGDHTIEFNSSGYENGLYTLKLQGVGAEMTQRMVIDNK